MTEKLTPNNIDTINNNMGYMETARGKEYFELVGITLCSVSMKDISSEAVYEFTWSKDKYEYHGFLLYIDNGVVIIG